MRKNDVEIYYSGSGPMAAGIASGLFFYLGLIVVGIVAAIPPINIYNPENPTNHLLSSNSEYENGY